MTKKFTISNHMGKQKKAANTEVEMRTTLAHATRIEFSTHTKGGHA
jgi:hypothetical protein